MNKFESHFTMKIVKVSVSLFLIQNSYAVDSSKITTASFSENVFKSFTDLKAKVQSKNKESLLKGSVDFRHNQVVDNVGEVPGNSYFGSLDLKYDSLSDTGVYKAIDIRARMNDEEVLQYSIKEALYELKYSNSRVGFGRTNLEWSQIDNTWSLGKINNRINFDYFEMDREGLIGVFYDEKFSNGFDFGFFVSELYVPEMSQGMIIDQNKGTITCKTPWCDAPASSAEINGSTIPIYYKVEYPDISDVVFKTSTGIRLGYSMFNDRVYITGFGMVKPENEMSVTAEISTPASNNVINVVATPQFYYHTVYGANVELRPSEQLKLYSSAITSVPSTNPDGDEPLIEYTGIKPKKKKEEYIGFGAKYSNGDFKGHLGYIARVSEFDTENDILVNYPRWNQALTLALSKNLTRKVFVGLDIKYDMLTEDRLTVFKTDYMFGEDLIATFGVNVIGTNPDKESYWSKFENNDAAYTSLKYKF